MQGLGDIASRFARDVRGTTAIEYGLIATLVAVGALAGMTALGTGVTDSWGNTTQRLVDAMSSAGDQQ